MTTFKELGLSAELLNALDKLGYTDPTPIQLQAIPDLLNGADVIGQAQTGTGKTAAFGLPMLQSIDPEIREVQALVLTPTRELCIQVAQSLRAYGAARGIDVLATFGGAPIRQQMDRLKAGPQVVVGTVGRVLDLHGRHSLMFHDARFVVLDEADEMLDLGFLEDVELILRKCPNGRQTALFSATMPAAIAKLAERHLHDPITIKVKAPTLTIDTVDHFQMPVKRSDKIDALIEVLSAERPRQALVFVRTKIGVDRLAKDLDRRKPGLRVRALHGDMSQGSRDGVMISFKEGRVPVLVATDIAARGLDVENVTHVINFDLPNSAEIYTHRIGRTGRAGRGGTAITLVETRDREDMAGIEKHINVAIPEWSATAKRGGAAAKSGDGEAKSGGGDGDGGGTGGGDGGNGEKKGADERSERSSRSGAERGERTARTRRPRTRPEAAALSEAAVESEADSPADDGAEAIAVEAAVESGLIAGDDAAVRDDFDGGELDGGAATLDDAVEATSGDDFDVPSDDDVDVSLDDDVDVTSGDDFDVTFGDEVEATSEDDVDVTFGDEVDVTSEDDVDVTSDDESEGDDTVDVEMADEVSGGEVSDGEASGEQGSGDQQSDEQESDDESSEDEPPADESQILKPIESIELRHPRHLKPTQENVNDDGEYSLLIVGAGAATGVEPADVIEMIRAGSGLSGEEVRRVRVLARFTLVRVPDEKARSVAEKIDGGMLRGRPVRAEAINGDS